MPSDSPSQTPWTTGVIGCLDVESLKNLDDDDYAEQCAQKVIEMIEKFATPLGEDRDDAVYDKFQSATRSIIVDGALLKSAQVLRLKFLKKVIFHILLIKCNCAYLVGGSHVHRVNVAHNYA